MGHQTLKGNLKKILKGVWCRLEGGPKVKRRLELTRGWEEPCRDVVEMFVDRFSISVKAFARQTIASIGVRFSGGNVLAACAVDKSSCQVTAVGSHERVVSSLGAVSSSLNLAPLSR